MNKYTKVKINCYSYHEMLHEYELKYKADYQLIGYEFNSLDHVGELILYPRIKIGGN